jgi:hypothetical protein
VKRNTYRLPAGKSEEKNHPKDQDVDGRKKNPFYAHPNPRELLNNVVSSMPR